MRERHECVRERHGCVFERERKRDMSMCERSREMLRDIASKSERDREKEREI